MLHLTELKLPFRTQPVYGSIRDYISDHKRKLALGRSLREDALEWWTDNAILFDNFNELVDAMQQQYKDRTRPGDHIRKINGLVHWQTCTTREFFRAAEKFNRYAKFPDEALWKALKEGLKAPLRASLATIRHTSHEYQPYTSLY